MRKRFSYRFVSKSVICMSWLHIRILLKSAWNCIVVSFFLLRVHSDIVATKKIVEEHQASTTNFCDLPEPLWFRMRLEIFSDFRKHGLLPTSALGLPADVIFQVWSSEIKLHGTAGTRAERWAMSSNCGGSWTLGSSSFFLANRFLAFFFFIFLCSHGTKRSSDAPCFLVLCDCN